MHTKPAVVDQHKTPRSTIGLHSTTKNRLDKGRALGQSYDGFLCQLMDLWDKSRLQNTELLDHTG